VGVRNVGTAQIDSPNMCPFKAIYREKGSWKAIGNRLLKPCHLSRDNYYRKIRTRKRTNVGKYYFVNGTIKSCNQLPAGLLASFPCKLNTFKERVKNGVTSRKLKWGLSVNK